MNRRLLADDLHLGVQLDPALGLRFCFDDPDERQHIRRRRTVVVDDEIAVDLRDFCPAYPRAFRWIVAPGETP